MIFSSYKNFFIKIINAIHFINIVKSINLLFKLKIVKNMIKNKKEQL